MRWGQRKPGTGAASTHPKSSGIDKHTSEDAANAGRYLVRAKTPGQGVKNLSNKELQHLVNRMELEQRYSKVTNSAPGKSSAMKGAEAVRSMGQNVLKTQVQVAAGAIIAKQLSTVLKAKGLV